MKIDKFPPMTGGRKRVISTPFTREWVLELIDLQGGSPTIREILEAYRSADADRGRTILAFQAAFDDGDIECHHTSVGKRGRPRYEFRVAKK